MARRTKPVETRWVVFKDYYSEDGHNMVSDFPILYSTEAEAKSMMERLNVGSDKSFFDKDNEESAFLYVDMVTL